MKKKINTELKELLDQEPFTTGKKANANILEAFQSSLAEAYAVDGWRIYMENLINMLVRDTVINFDNIEQIRYKQGKVAGLKELLTRSKKAFELGTKINQIHSLEQQIKEVKL